MAVRQARLLPLGRVRRGERVGILSPLLLVRGPDVFPFCRRGLLCVASACGQGIEGAASVTREGGWDER